MSPQPDHTPGYIHSFSQAEQERLVRQGVFLEPYVFPSIDYSGCRNVIEVGCGVGAQIAVLLRHWPELVVTGVDRAAVQLGQARALLKSAIAAGRAQLARGEGTRLPFPDGGFADRTEARAAGQGWPGCGFADRTEARAAGQGWPGCGFADRTEARAAGQGWPGCGFDGAFVCWVLEHAGDPVGVLKEIRRVLAPGGVLYATEVFNSGMYAWPACPATEQYWREFNRYQRDLGGDPDVGAKLANLASRAGFTDVTARYLTPQLDKRMSDTGQRREFMAMWTRLLMSAAPALQAEGRIPAGLAEKMARELQALADDPDAVFVYMAVQVRARG